jgi:Core-2/I-Branching enzyme
MPHAAVVLAHHLPDQLERLLARIAGPDDPVWVHVDARSPMPLPGHPHAVYLPRLKCGWGDVNVVRAALSGMAAALASARPFTHLSVLTGQDYPIKPLTGLRALLDANPQRGWLDWHALPGPAPGDELARVDRRYYGPRGTRRLSLPNRYIPVVPRRRPPLGLPFYKGSALFTLSRSQVEHVVAFTRRHPEFVRYFKRAYVADEYVFQTILVNSEHRGDLVAHNLHDIVFDAGSHHARTLTEDDLDRLRASERYFTRKLDMRAAPALLDRIDAELLGTPAR